MTYHNSLVGYWPLDEDSGSTAFDYSGNENDGTANGAGPSGTGTAAGPLGATAYDFDGTDDRITTPVTGNFGTGNYTVSAWVNPTNVPPDDSKDEDIVSTYNGTNGWILMINQNGNHRFFLASGSDISSSSSPTAGSWTHVAGVVGSSDTKLYADGSELVSSSRTADESPTEDVVIGRRPTQDNHWNGKIADVRIYDRALTDSEMAYLYQVGQRARMRTSTKTF